MCLLKKTNLKRFHDKNLHCKLKTHSRAVQTSEHSVHHIVPVCPPVVQHTGKAITDHLQFSSAGNDQALATRDIEQLFLQFAPPASKIVVSSAAMKYRAIFTAGLRTQATFNSPCR